MTSTVTTTDGNTVIEGKPDGHGRTSTGGRVVGYWVNLDEAADRLGVSERTLRRWIADDKISHRKISGRRQVRLDPDDMTANQDAETDTAATHDGHGGHGHPSGHAVTDTAEGSTAAELVILTRGLVERRADELRQDARRARRHAGTAWTIAAVLTLATGAGAVWGVLTLDDAQDAAAELRASLDDTEAERAAEVARTAAERERAERLAAELIDARADATAAERALLAERIEGLTRPRPDTTPDSWATAPTLLDMD